MELSDTDLVAFRMRCLMAAERGYLIAHAHEYMESLEAEAGPQEPPGGTEPGSAAHLAELAGAVLEVRGSGGKKKGKKDKTPKVEAKEPEPEKTPEPPVVVTPPEPEKAAEPEGVKVETPEVLVTEPAKTETVVEVKDAPKEEEVPPYETWNKDALVEEAHARKLQTSSRMTKAEVIELLEADDAKAEAK